MDIKNIKDQKIHFIAAGGVGMSALALYLAQAGAIVSGSDIQESKYTQMLEKAGIKVHIGHDASLIQKGMSIAASSAVTKWNPELLKAEELGLPVYHRSDILKMISDEFSQNPSSCFIGFSGTHGKTTTSGLAAYLLEKAGGNPSFAAGGLIPELNVNAKYGGKRVFIAELDESDGTIEKYSTDIAVINNLEEDHIDFYKKGWRDIAKTFDKFLNNKPGQKVIINADDEGCQRFMQLYPDHHYITFGIDFGDYSAANIVKQGLKSSFDIFVRSKFYTSIKLSVPGTHNIYNALAVSAALAEAGVNINAVKPYFSSFSGMARRFQKAGEYGGLTIFDDYAHHPGEIKAVLNAVKEAAGAGTRIAVIFQPHRYSRLQRLWHDFKEALEGAGIVFVTDVYPAGEAPLPGITGELFAKDMDSVNVIYARGNNMQEAAKNILPLLKSGDIVLTLGAGSITNIGKYLLAERMKNVNRI